MEAILVTQKIVDGTWCIITVIKYSNNTHVKRIYNNNGILVDAIRIDISNQII